ncbi:MAG: preprotein translocase subunit SecG [Chthoniobacterales bacterium]|nr:preprotein translocase subunit SecG [Chthoniobacterales bacterium]
MTILINSLLVLEALVAVLMMFVILMQRPKSEGLGAAFGGGVTENIFGAQTTTVLTTATTWLASIFFILVLLLSVLYAHRGAPNSALRRELMKTSAPAKAAAPLPPKVAAQKAAADAKAKLVPVPQGTVAPGAGTASSPSAAAAAVGVVPAGAPVATPAASVQPTP